MSARYVLAGPVSTPARLSAPASYDLAALLGVVLGFLAGIALGGAA